MTRSGDDPRNQGETGRIRTRGLVRRVRQRRNGCHRPNIVPHEAVLAVAQQLCRTGDADRIAGKRGTLVPSREPHHGQ